jgi:hypothetical protein
VLSVGVVQENVVPTLQVDVEQLSKLLKQVFEAWPFYRRLEYQGADKLTSIPALLKLFCPRCELETSWYTDIWIAGTGIRTSTRVLENNKNGFCTKEYRCKNCGASTVRYYFWWGDELGTSVFFKVGQHPELEERVSEVLEKALTAEDLKSYKNALRLRNFNLGIASVAYMRRVVENRMNDMLQVLYEAAVAHNAPKELLALHEAMMKEKRFSVKVDYAGDLLPETLRPKGMPNPMAILHDLVSDGLHAKSDEECVDIFDACRHTFEYVFGKLRIETEEAKKFVEQMTALAEKKARANEAKIPREKN